MGTVKIEAELMTLVGYTPENSIPSSGGKVINTTSTGTATTKFTGTAGIYDLKVVYHDENDGNSPVSVKVDGVVVGSWVMNEATDSAIASAGNRRERVITGLTLNTNSVIEIRGTKEGNEYARLDYIEIASVGVAPPTPTPTPTPPTTPPISGTTILQAEAAYISGAVIDTLNGGAQGSYVDYKNATGDFIEWTVNAPAAGSYDLSWRYANGATNRPLSFSVNGTVVDNSLAFNGTGAWNVWDFASKTVALKAGINKVRLQANGSSGANFDYLQIAPTVLVPPLVDVTINPGSTTGVGRLEAELMTLVGYTPENSIPSSGGKVINTTSTGTATTKFTGTAGSYNLKVVYHDENDGNSPVSVKVDGVVVGSWVMNEATDSAIASAGNRRERVITGLTLNTNSVIEIRGTKEGNEYARLDYIEIASVGATPPVSDTVILQAEAAYISGAVIDTLNGGAQGSYVDYKNATGDFIEWTVNAPAAGSYDLSWRYANGATNRPLSFSVNGTVVDNSLAFNGTGAWNVWDFASKTVALKAGINKVRLQANGSSGANFDYLQIAPAGSAPPRKLRILPLGDSNTRGEGTPGGYRTKFWERAVNDGISIDFLGTRNDGPDSLGDRDHQGQGGWAIPQMTDWIRAGNLAAQNPEIILFMMGTNDANTDGAVSATTIRNRLSTLIDEVAKAVPKAYLFVSSILPLDTPRGTSVEAKVASDFNALIPNLVSQKALEGKLVSYVNAGGSLNVGDINGDNSATADQDDGLHATAAGYDKLGNAWYNLVSQSSVWKNAVAALSSIGFSTSPTEASTFTDSLTGNGQNNFLEGGDGFDELTGGGGSDTFVYRKPSNGLDRITDFSSDDLLLVSASGFGGDLVAGSTLDSSNYVLGSDPIAKNGSATFLYNTGNNTLSFDADGSGDLLSVGIATFANGFAPQASQIEIFA